MAIINREELSSREYQEFNHRKIEFELQATHSERLKDKEIELAKLEVKWSSWLRIPITIIKLPVLFLFGIAYCIAVARKFELGDNFWSFINK